MIDRLSEMDRGAVHALATGGGLVYRGVVTNIPGANQFDIPTLAGLGAGNLVAPAGALPWLAFVFRDAGGAGAAPQGEFQAVTAYDTTLGRFTTAAFTAAVAAGDEMFIMSPILVQGVPVADVATNIMVRDVIGNKNDAEATTVAAGKSLMAYIRGLVNAKNRVTLVKDQWCALPIASLAIPAAAADLTLSNVVFPASFLPAGAVVQAVYLMVKWRKQVDSSGAANAINGAGKSWRVKKTGGAWGVDDVEGIVLADNQMATASNATEGGDMIIGDVDIKGEVDDVDNETYNVMGENTNRGDAPVVDGASLTIHDVYTGLRVYYTLG